MASNVQYAITVDGKLSSLVSTKEAALLCIQAIASAVARDVAIQLIEVHDLGKISLAKTA